ncbi:hypothetical protein BDW74DRAFT_177725 [Aspergillus multicolor]|uniref:uncharacterized protein n=1 Tax=Aspergillus multicolor TaxID=41759 RepID=UPI003CCE5087
MYAGGLPFELLKPLSEARLRAGPLSIPNSQSKKFRSRDALTAEIPPQGEAEPHLLSQSYPHVTVPAAISWQLNYHAGFAHAFLSSMRYGPILYGRQHETWQRLGMYLSKQKALSAVEQKLNGLASDKVIIMYGLYDTSICSDELLEDVGTTLGDTVVFKEFSAGHEFPSTQYDEIAQITFDALFDYRQS